MLQDLSRRTYSDDPADQALYDHVERWTAAYGAALIRFFRGRSDTHVDVLADFAWESGVLDLVVPLAHEKRDALRRAGAGLPWNDRLSPELYWRLMYAVCAEKAASSDINPLDREASRNPIRIVISTTAILVGQLAKPQGGSDPEFISNAFLPGTTRLGSALLQGFQDTAANQVRLRTGRSVKPKPIEPHSRVKIGEAVALLESYGHDGRVLLDRETPPPDPQGLEWAPQPKTGRWQAWAMPWLVKPHL